MNRTRDQRRANFEKKKKKAIKLLKQWSYFSEPSPKMIGMIAKTPVRCSGYCCGNPRHYHGNGAKTLAEKKAELELQEEIDLLI